MFKALVRVDQFERIEAELRENQCLQIADADGIFSDVVAEFVGLAVNLSALDATARHHHRERERMMIAADEIDARVVVLLHGRAAEFAAPDDQRRIQQAALFQVLDQPREGAVDLLNLDRQNRWDVFAGADAMVVPAPVVELNEAHTAFDEPPSQQAIVGEGRIGGDGSQFVGEEDGLKRNPIHRQPRIGGTGGGLNR